MLKRLVLALALAGLLSPAFGAGTLPGFSLSQQMGRDGKPLAGCVLKFYQAGTVATPQTAYQDSGLTIPIAGGAQATCDAFGRIGQFFLADGSIKILLTDVNGVTQVTADGLLVIGASSGGGGGSPVDPTTVLSPCDMKLVYGTGILTGFVRMNGRTIGNAVSGATERANADTLAAFTCLYANDNNLVVSGGRGASAAADYAAGKTIATPDMRGRAPAGLDDMGNSAAGRLTATYFGASGGCSGVLGTTLGAACGSESVTLALSHLPLGITSANTASIALSVTSTSAVVASNVGNTSPSNPGITTGVALFGSIASTGTIGIGAAAVTSNNTGGLAHRTVQPTMLTTFYIKL